MYNRRFSPVMLACAAAISLFSAGVQAQTTGNLNLLNNSSLGKGMSAAGARTFEALSSVNSKGPNSADGTAPNGNNNGSTTASVGTTGTTGGTNGSTITGTTGGGKYDSDVDSHDLQGPNKLTGGSSGDNYDLQGPNKLTGGGKYANDVDSWDLQGPNKLIGGNAAAGGLDWLKIVQVGAPIVAGLTGNDKIGQVAGIVGSGAQIYGAVSTGQDLTTQNYANIGNIALQTAALATNNTRIDQAAQLGTIATGAWNTYSAVKPNGTSGSAQGQMVQVGTTANGQAVYQSTVPTSTMQSGPSWGTMGTIAAGIAPQVGQVLGNANIGQAGALVGNVAAAYERNNGFQAGPTGYVNQVGAFVNNGFQAGAPGFTNQVGAFVSNGSGQSTGVPASVETRLPTGTPMPKPGANIDNYDFQGPSRPNAIPMPKPGGADNWDLQGPSSVNPINAIPMPKPGANFDNYDIQGQSFVTDPRVTNPDNFAVSKPLQVTNIKKPFQGSVGGMMADTDVAVSKPLQIGLPTLSQTVSNSVPVSSNSAPITAATTSSGPFIRRGGFTPEQAAAGVAAERAKLQQNAKNPLATPEIFWYQ